MSNSGQNPPENPPEWLPSGWVVEIRSNNGRNVRSYVEQTTGHIFYSKPKVLEYLRSIKKYNSISQMETARPGNDINLPEKLNQTPTLLPHQPVTETPIQDNLSQSGKFYEPAASEPLHFGKVEAEKSPDWLPSGWTEEVKEKDGRIVKTYVDPLWGHRFYTKPQVLQYLGALRHDSSSSQKEISGNNSGNNLLGKMNGTPKPLPHVSTTSAHWENGSQSKFSQLGSSEMSNSRKMVAEKTPDWLPAGWTEEFKVNNGRRYKTFVDQLSGRRFYSKPKVLEYLEAANNGGRISGRKKMANDFDINVPANISDPLEPLPHGRFTGLESQKNGSQSAITFEPEVDKTEGAVPVPQLVESQNMNTFDSTIHLKATSSRTRAGRKPDIKETEGLIPVPQPIKSQSRNTFESTITPKETSSRKMTGRKPNMDKTDVVNPLPQLVESQSMYTSAKETTSSIQPGGKVIMDLLPEELPPGWVTEIKTKRTGNQTKKVKYYIDPVSEYVFSSKKDAWRYSEAGDVSKCAIKPKKREEMGFNTEHSLPYMDKTEVVTPLPQLLESRSMYTSPKDTTSSKQSGGKVIVEHLPEDLPPGWVTEIKTKKTGNQTKTIKYYIDPVSGYVFSSKKDAWRYSEAGDVSKCVIKPKKREEMGFNTKHSLPNVDKIGNRCSLQPSEEPEQTPFQRLDEPKHVNTRKREHFSQEAGKVSSSKQCDSEMVIERVTAEGLPSGWIKEVKTEKFYTDPRSGYVFMSQKDALLYLQTGDIGTCAVKPRSRDELGLNDGNTPKTNKAGGHPLQQLEQLQIDNTPRLTRSSRRNQLSPSKQITGEIVAERVTPYGTPRGTIKMSKPRGKPALQQLARSPDVNTPMHASLSSPQKEVTFSKHNGTEILFERVAPTGLPPGWIKEIMIQKRADGIRKDNLYTDPVSGFAFRSEKDVFRFLKTGDVRSCAMRPKKREELGCNQVASPAVAQKVVSDATEKQLTSTKPNKRNLGTLDTEVSQTRRQTRSSSKLEHDRTKQQNSSATGRVGSKRRLETMDSNVHQKRRQTRYATSSAVMQNIGCDTPEKQLPTGKKLGFKRSLETMDSDVSEKRRQTRSSASVVTGDALAGLPKEVPKLEKVIQKPMKAPKGNASKSPSKTRTKASQRGRGSIRSPPSTVNRKVKSVRSTPSTVNVKVKNVRSPPSSKKLKVKDAKKKAEKKSNEKIHSPASKSKKKETNKEMRTPPSRISKRIMGIGAETVTNSGLIEKALPSTVKKARKNKDIPRLTDPNNLASCEQAAPTSAVENSEEGKDTSCPTQNHVVSFEQTLTSELENSGKTENVPCPNMADNTPQEPESVPEVGGSEVENLGQNKDIQCSDTPVVFYDAPNELETVSVINKTNHALGDIEAVLIAEGSNKCNEAAVNQVEDQEISPEKPTEVSDQSKTMENQEEDLIISKEQPSEVSTQSKGMGNQEEDVFISQGQPVEVSNQRNEAKDDNAEDQMVSQELPAEVSNKGEGLEDQAEEQTVSQETSAEVSKKIVEDKAEDQIVSQEQPAKVSNKTTKDKAEYQTASQEPLSEVSNKSEPVEDQIENQTVSQEQTAEVSNKTMGDKAEDQTVSQEQPAEVSSKSLSMDDQIESQTVSQEQPTEKSNKSDSKEDQAEGKTMSQEPPTQVSNKIREAMENKDKNQRISQDQQMYQFGEESWSDPCLDFAFKTLTGKLSFDDSVFQTRDDASQPKTAENCLSMLNFDATQANNSHSQNASETLTQVDSSDNNEALVIPGTECPTAPIYLPDMNSNLPTASENAPRQTDFEEDKNDDKKELTLDNYARFLF